MSASYFVNVDFGTAGSDLWAFVSVFYNLNSPFFISSKRLDLSGFEAVSGFNFVLLLLVFSYELESDYT